MNLSAADRHTLVIGAGLTGSALCAALTRRGWTVTLLDAASGPAKGASGLPVGMLSEHVTRAPTPLSRLSALGVPDMRAELERLIPPGEGWQHSEVDNLGHNPGRWPATLVTPATVVRAWLSEASATGRLHALWNASVHRLRFVSGQWQALDPASLPLAQAPTTVVAAAHGSHELLLQSLELHPDSLPLRPVQGQLSYAEQSGHALMPRPQRNNGVFVPLYEYKTQPPGSPSRLWAMGSTYERGMTHCHVTQEAHERNLDSLQTLCAEAAQQGRQALARGELLGWAQVRCASLDRLPLMGAMPHPAKLDALAAETGNRRSRLPLAAVPRWPGLFTLCALGSRGLTLSHWCAEQLARQIDGEAPDVPPEDLDLINALDPARYSWKRLRQTAPAELKPGG